MSDAEPLIIAPPGVSFEPPEPPLPAGSCPECKADEERFQATLGGGETCMQCGHQRKAGAHV